MKLQEMKDKAVQLRESQSGWKSCQDGSYEMALDHVGYYKLMKEIRELEETIEEAEAEAEPEPEVDPGEYHCDCCGYANEICKCN